MQKPLLPFGLLPGHWGLKGKTRDRAQAEYELCGYELALRLAKIDSIDESDFSMRKLALYLEYQKITKNQYDRKFAEDHLADGEKEQTLELLRLDHIENKISDLEYEKAVSTENKESWVHIIDINIAKGSPNHGELNIDWNDYFVEELRAGGYESPIDEEVVELWLADLCRNIAMEQFSGIGDFDENVNEQFIQKTKKSDDGKWEAS